MKKGPSLYVCFLSDASPHSYVLGPCRWISIAGHTEEREREGEVKRKVGPGEFGADSCALAGKLGSKVRTEPPMIPTTRMERTLMWNPHRVLQRRLRVETDWQFIL